MMSQVNQGNLVVGRLLHETFSMYINYVFLSPFCGITKEIMSRGPQVADMKCRETT
jgi:hypothetical protein